MEFNRKMEDVNKNYKERLEECDKLQTELAKVRSEYETSKTQMELELQDLQKNVTSISETKETKEVENLEIKQRMTDLTEKFSQVSAER